MKNGTVIKDERTTAVENASYRWSYLVISFGLLLDVMYRSFFRQEASWDLLGLVILAGLVGTLYQSSQKILTRRWVIWAALTAVIAAVVALIIIFVR